MEERDGIKAETGHNLGSSGDVPSLPYSPKKDGARKDEFTVQIENVNL